MSFIYQYTQTIDFIMVYAKYSGSCIVNYTAFEV